MLCKISVGTKDHSQLKDITREVDECVKNSGVESGICLVYCPHTTAGITVNENADPDVVRDILSKTGRLIPWEDDYRHFEGNSAAHIKAMLSGFSQTFIIENGRLLLGTWQGIYFAEFDGPRSRTVYVKIIGEKEM